MPSTLFSSFTVNHPLEEDKQVIDKLLAVVRRKWMVELSRSRKSRAQHSGKPRRNLAEEIPRITQIDLKEYDYYDWKPVIIAVIQAYNNHLQVEVQKS